MRKAATAVIAILSTFFLAPVAAYAAPDQPTKLSFSIWQQPDHYMVKAIRQWASDVERRTNGAVAIEFFYGGALTKGEQAYDGIVKGISDVAAAATGWNAAGFR
jgi:TRAP-type C4-dicarboxylate transport system substrate-binding protein